MYLKGEKFLWTNWKAPEQGLTEDGFRVSNKELDLGYWRKHPDLHGYIVATFAGGKDDCQKIELDAEDLQNIIAAINAGKLPHTEGFFFGTSEDDPPETDIKILTAALKWLEEQEPNVTRSVYYRASW